MPDTPGPCACRDDDEGVVGVEIPGVYDGVLYWRCELCGKRWHRFTEALTPYLYDLAAPYVSGERDA